MEEEGVDLGQSVTAAMHLLVTGAPEVTAAGPSSSGDHKTENTQMSCIILYMVDLSVGNG
jgi:hypothetical protein